MTKKSKPGAKKVAVSLNEIQWAAVREALRVYVNKEGGPLGLLRITGPYKKLFKQVLRAETSIIRQLKQNR